MRFRKSGVNWEGRSWHLAPSLVRLAEQVEQAYPAGQPGDGTVASQTHDRVSPNSDHRPSPHLKWTGAVVRAIDVGETSETVTQSIVDALVASRDPRIAYIIYEGRSVWSVYRNGRPAWTWGPYGGPNPHSGHFHLSIKRTTAADTDIRPWQIGDDMPSPKDWTPEDWKAFDTHVVNNSVGAYIGKGDARRTIAQAISNTEINVAKVLKDISTLDTTELRTLSTAIADELARRIRD